MKKMMIAMFALLASSSAFAQEAVAAAAPTNDRGLVAIAAALAIGLAVFGGAMGQGKTAATALRWYRS